MHQINTFLNKGISRKTYLEFFLLGLLFSPLVFFGSIFLGLALKESGATDTVSLYIALGGFVLIGVYFYVLKVKRLHDLGQSSEIIAPSHTIPGGDLILHFSLFFRNKPPLRYSKHATELKHKSKLGTLLEKLLVYLMFFGINYGLLYMTGTFDGYTDWMHGYFRELPAILDQVYTTNKLDFYTGAAYFFALYFVFPYINAHYFWIYLQKWQIRPSRRFAHSKN